MAKPTRREHPPQHTIHRCEYDDPVYTSYLVAHQRSQCFDLLKVHSGRETNSTLDRCAMARVLRTVRTNDFKGAILPFNWECDTQNTIGRLHMSERGFINLGDFGGLHMSGWGGIVEDGWIVPGRKEACAKTGRERGNVETTATGNEKRRQGAVTYRCMYGAGVDDDENFRQAALDVPGQRRFRRPARSLARRKVPTRIGSLRDGE